MNPKEQLHCLLKVDEGWLAERAERIRRYLKTRNVLIQDRDMPEFHRQSVRHSKNSANRSGLYFPPKDSANQRPQAWLSTAMQPADVTRTQTRMLMQCTARKKTSRGLAARTGYLDNMKKAGLEGKQSNPSYGPTFRRFVETMNKTMRPCPVKAWEFEQAIRKTGASRGTPYVAFSIEGLAVSATIDTIAAIAALLKSGKTLHIGLPKDPKVAKEIQAAVAGDRIAKSRKAVQENATRKAVKKIAARNKRAAKRTKRAA